MAWAAHGVLWSQPHKTPLGPGGAKGLRVVYRMTGCVEGVRQTWVSAISPKSGAQNGRTSFVCVTGVEQTWVSTVSPQSGPRLPKTFSSRGFFKNCLFVIPFLSSTPQPRQENCDLDDSNTRIVFFVCVFVTPLTEYAIRFFFMLFFNTWLRRFGAWHGPRVAAQP